MATWGSELTEEGTSRLAKVWEPVDIGPVRLRNRIVVPARTLNWSVDEVLSDRHLAHFGALADGGVGLIITEQHAAHAVTKGSFARPCTAAEKRAIPRLEKFAETVRDRGARGIVQLFGAGVNDKGTMLMDEWHPLWAASRVPSVVHGETGMTMDRQQIAEFVKGFGESAANAKMAGVDGIEIHAANGYLGGQFLSVSYNNRTDEYGGSVEGRCRFVKEIGEAVREHVGTDMAVGLRISYDEFMGDAGITAEEADQQIELFADTGLFDYFSISGGSYHHLYLNVAPMSEPDGHLVYLAKRAKEVVDDRAKIVTVGRIRDLHVAETALTTNSADMVAIGRAHLADPELVKKTKEGREAEITECVGWNECVGRLFDQKEVICAMNPVTGREQRWGTPDQVVPTEAKRILVVGGGPAGMKTAAVAARRGHSVTLLEREEALGGHFNLWGKMPGRRGWSTATDNLVRAVNNAGVAVRCGVKANVDSLNEYNADTVVLATGSDYDRSGSTVYRPNRDHIPGIENIHVMDLREACTGILGGASAFGNNVLILDESGEFMALSLAEMLAKQGGTTVHFITPHNAVGHDTLRQQDLQYILPRLNALRVDLRAQRVVESISSDGTITLDHVWGCRNETIEKVSSVVVSVYKIPRGELYEQITDSHRQVVRVGDCVAPRAPKEIMYEGEKLGREL